MHKHHKRHPQRKNENRKRKRWKRKKRKERKKKKEMRHEHILNYNWQALPWKFMIRRERSEKQAKVNFWRYCIYLFAPPFYLHNCVLLYRETSSSSYINYSKSSCPKFSCNSKWAIYIYIYILYKSFRLWCSVHKLWNSIWVNEYEYWLLSRSVGLKSEKLLVKIGVWVWTTYMYIVVHVWIGCFAL